MAICGLGPDGDPAWGDGVVDTLTAGLDNAAMAQPKPAQPVQLLVGLLAGRAEWLDAGVAELVEAFGPVEAVSEDYPFTFTDYYAPTMGAGLVRRFVAFERLIDPASLADIKRATNALEARLAERIGQVDRPVNLDPGYVAPGKLVLASAKDFAHRVYLGQGIYAEVTLQFRHGRWVSSDWTFPDYASGLYDAFLTGVRDRLRSRLRPARP